MGQWLGRLPGLRSGDSWFKTHSDHLLNLFLVFPCSTSQLHLYIVNWFAPGQLRFSTVAVVVLFHHFVDYNDSLALKSPYGERSIRYVLCIVLCNKWDHRQWNELHVFLITGCLVINVFLLLSVPIAEQD